MGGEECQQGAGDAVLGLDVGQTAAGEFAGGERGQLNGHDGVQRERPGQDSILSVQ